MTPNSMRTMLAKYLKLATSSAYSSDPVPDPLPKFLQAVKAGRYRHMTPKELAALKNDIAEQSELFYEEGTALPADLLIRALFNLNLDYRTCLIAADVIAKAVAEKGKPVIQSQDDSDFMMIPEGTDGELPFFTPDDEFKLSSLTPQDIYTRLSSTVWGQDEAKRSLSMLVYNHLHDRPSNLLIGGPTGSGKSALIEALKKIPGLPVTVIDSSRLGPDGYRSSAKIQDAFPPGENYHKIVVFDEFDKACQKHESSSGTNYTQLLLNNFLILLEHKPLTFSAGGGKEESYTADTSKTSFILIGAWENMMQSMDAKTGGIGFGAAVKKAHNYANTALTPEDFIKYGVRREVIGRISDFAYLNPITPSDFRCILDTPELSPISKIEEEYKVKLTLTDALKNCLAEKAYASGLGCRAIYSEIKRKLNLIMFRDCDQKEYHLDIDDPITTFGTRKPAQAALVAADADI